jgi:hypothetical protein
MAKTGQAQNEVRRELAVEAANLQGALWSLRDMFGISLRSIKSNVKLSVVSAQNLAVR